jgi:tRNA-splicing endonuclease subunit Sen54
MKACCLTKTCRFLAERGALILLSDKDETIGIEGIYEKLAGGNYGCSWDTFQAYKQLKSLGYIVGRFGVPWTMKHGSTCDTIAPQMNILEIDQSLNKVDGASNDITKLLRLRSVIWDWFLAQPFLHKFVLWRNSSRPRIARSGTTEWSLKEMQIDGISPFFEVYLPNSKFKKSSAGSPSFLLCLLR